MRLPLTLSATIAPARHRVLWRPPIVQRCESLLRKHIAAGYPDLLGIIIANELSSAAVASVSEYYDEHGPSR